MISFNLDDATADRLRQLATLYGVANVEEYLRAVAGVRPEPTSSTRTVDEFDAELEPLLTAGPTLPADFSRADIYADHD